MRATARRTIALAGVALVVSGAVAALMAPPPAYASRPRQVIVRRVTTLDARGHLAHIFRPGSKIQLRIQWTVRGAPPHARQTTTWSVFYAGKEVLHVTRTSLARDGSWSRVTIVTVSRTPHLGTHLFWGRVSVDGVSAVRSVAFTVQR